ncbi:GNAT family N-acetyltransferase [Nocardiopsis sp. RSe5-2]|uniref:GNAT family N-acetyltransferase n=1 Tax=Nocardiopsis endophytica TaxID=3018445 RepID=A0ABT4UCZ3_9ACTN|nr:GNAT family N-acetyltransferase [Nocardiopsis endophytica]MDA2814220.1 GNAT family N-acetyltransferase [Nocardiopsis endophytica]
MRIRKGGPDDVPSVLAMLDGAVEWLTARGREGQWGSQPWSEFPERVRRIEDKADGLWMAEIGGEPAGALALSPVPEPYVDPAPEPELYVGLLVTARAFTGRGVGARLLGFARDQARERGVALLRVDCWAGGDGALIAYYERQGFTPTERVPVGTTAVQVFEMRV